MPFASRRLILALAMLAVVAVGATTAIVLAANRSETPDARHYTAGGLSPTPRADEASASGDQTSPMPSQEAESEASPLAPYQADGQATPAASYEPSSDGDPSASTETATSVTPTAEPCSAVGGVDCETVTDAGPTDETDTLVQPTVGMGPGVGEEESGAVSPSRHEVSIRFNETVQQSDIGEVAALVATYDSDANFVVLELFPPIARAVVETDIPGFCDDLKARLEGRPYIASVSCE